MYEDQQPVKLKRPPTTTTTTRSSPPTTTQSRPSTQPGSSPPPEPPPEPPPKSMYSSRSESLAESRSSSESSSRSSSWKMYTILELIKFRDEITALLPPLELSKMNMEQELLLQFHSLRALQTDTLDDEDLPLNQRAQVASTVTAALVKLVEMQGEVYKQERFKVIELLLIRHLSKLPENVAQEFLADYERSLQALS